MGKETTMRKTMIASVAAGLLAGAAGSAAFADEPYRPAPVNAGPYSWTGLYIGASAGYAFGNTETMGAAAGDSDVTVRGAQGIVTVGYDFRLSPGWLFGLFADYAFGEVDGSILGGTLDKISSTIDNQWAIGARLGYLRASTLWYATAGYTEADWHVQLGPKGHDETLSGYFVGLGVEQAFSQALSLKLEYRFSSYDTVPGALSFDNEVSSIRVGVNWKLGR